MSPALYTNPVSYSAAERLDEAIEWLLIGLLAFMPLTFGAVQAWSEQIVLLGAAAISLCFLAKIIIRDKTALVFSWAYVPILLFLLVILFQLAPLPLSVLKAISPGTAAVKQELLSKLGAAVDGSMKLSFYPNATIHDLRIVLAVSAIFCVVLNVYRHSDQIKRLLCAIAIIGGAMALLGVVEKLTGTNKIYWTVPTVANRYWFGTFILHSHYSQFMNLSIGATVALALVVLQERFGGSPITPVVVSEYFCSPQSRFVWVLLGITVLGVSTVFMSLSRAGMISLLIAGSFTTLLLTSRRSLKGSGWAIALIALCAFMCVLYVGFDAVYERLGTLRDINQAQSGRLQILKDMSVSFEKFPVIGTGLGTHEVVYPMFDRSTSRDLAAHAENEYAQAAEETGLTGLSILVVFGVIVWAGYVRNVRSEAIPIRSAAYGLGMGLMAISIHSLSDFGQHLPANAMLSAIFCALILSLTRMGREYHRGSHVFRASRIPKAVRIGMFAAAAGIWLTVMVSSNSARAAEAYWKQARRSEESLRARNWSGDNAKYQHLIEMARVATEKEPDNIKYHHWLNVYRWESINRYRDPNSGDLILNDQTLGFTQQIADELLAALPLCPTYGPTWCVAGQLEKFVLDKPAGADLIRTGYKLAPCDPTTCFVAGLLDATDGSIDESFAKFQRALQLDSTLYPDVAKVYIKTLKRPDLAVSIAGDNSTWLSMAAKMLSSDTENSDLVDAARKKIREVLTSKAADSDAPGWVFAALARICDGDGESEDAIKYWRRALALEYGQVEWHLMLASSLAKVGQIDEAKHEAQICLRFDPNFQPAKKLIARLAISNDDKITKAP